MTRRSAQISFLIPLALLVVSGCTAGTFVGGGASVGVAVAQERSVGVALDDTVIATQIVAIFFDYSIELLRKVSAEVVEGRVLLTGSVAEPEGRVDAVRLIDYKVRILDTGGTAATTRVHIDFEHGRSRWTTIGASTNIIEASWTALADGVEYAIVEILEGNRSALP